MTSRSFGKGPPLAVICLLPALGACVVGPNYRQPETKTPAAYGLADAASTSPTLNLARWWTTFGDEELNSLIGRATSANLDVKLAEARVREARASRREAHAGFLPLIETRDSYARFHRSATVGSSQPSKSASSQATDTSGSGSGTGSTPGGSSSSSSAGPVAKGASLENDLYQVGFDAAWEIDVFGGVRRSVEAADADIGAAIEGRNAALVTLLAEVATNYIEVRAAQAELSTTRRNLDGQMQTVELTRDRFQSGIASQLDVSRAEALAATTEALLPPLETDVAQAAHRLATLMGEEPGVTLRELAEPKPVPVAAESLASGLPAELLRRRPDIRRAERQLAAATARVGVATATLYPKFSLVGTLGLQTSEFNQLFEGKSRFWSIGPSVSWPIFDAGRIVADIEIQDARREQAYIVYEQTVLRAIEEAENAMAACANELRRREAIQRAVAANREASDLSHELYSRGVVDFLSVLDSERALLATETALARSGAAISANMIALYKALGGGWDPAAPEFAGPPAPTPDLASAPAPASS